MNRRGVFRAFIFLFCTLIFLTSCFFDEFEYQGDYPELFSSALGSILGTIGYEPHGLGFIPPTIEILEVDDFGRVLFAYSEDSTGDTTGFSRLILQKTEGEYAYFYPHYNFITNRYRSRSFTLEEINALKEANRWNQEMSDNSEFAKVRITRQKEAGPIPDKQLRGVYNDIFTDRQLTRSNNMRYWTIHLRDDNFGRSVYFSEGRSNGRYIFTVLFFHADPIIDSEIGILELSNRFNYQTELRLFMEANGWNTPSR